MTPEEYILDECKGNLNFPILRLTTIVEMMLGYAFLAYKAGEENGRKNLKPNGEIDLEGCEADFKAWVDGGTIEKNICQK